MPAGVMPVHVLGVGLLGPGLDGWDAGRRVLTGRAAWQHAPTVLPPPAILSPTERRRAGVVTRLALAVAAEAAAASGLPPESLRTVFASSNGDGPTVGAVLEAVAAPDGFVSPTQFHNSVHNAAAGYWSIGTGSTRPATSLGGHDATFAAGLMKAAAECVVEREPVMLVVYDAPFPPPLSGVRPTGEPFGLALVLAPDGDGPDRGGARMAVQWLASDAVAAQGPLPALAANPAANGVALLAALAAGGPARLALPMGGGHLRVDLQP